MAVVRLKGTPQGVTLVLEPALSDDELIRSLEEVLERHGEFLKGSLLDLDIGRRPLTKEVVAAVFDVLARHPGVGLGSLSARGERRARPARREATLVHYGTVRSGQLVEADGDLVVVGDVHAGGEVRAGGDIVVTGRLSGVAHAGVGEKGALATVYAARLEPEQVRIHGAVAVGDPEGPAPEGPEMAWLEDGTIVIAPAQEAIRELRRLRRRTSRRTSLHA